MPHPSTYAAVPPRRAADGVDGGDGGDVTSPAEWLFYVDGLYRVTNIREW